MYNKVVKLDLELWIKVKKPQRGTTLKNSLRL